MFSHMSVKTFAGTILRGLLNVFRRLRDDDFAIDAVSQIEQCCMPDSWSDLTLHGSLVRALFNRGE